MGNFDNVPTDAIKWRRNSDGLYLGKFTERDDAMEYVKKLAERYRATPAWENTIKDLCKEAEKDGVKVYPKPLGKWFRNVFNLSIARGNQKKSSNKRQITLYVWNSLADRLQNLVKKGDINLEKRSWFCNLILSIHMGIPVRELVVYFDDHIEVDEATVDKLPVIFYYENEQEVRALNIFQPPKQTQRLIEDWCRLSMEEIKLRARQHGLQTLGGNFSE